MSRRAVLLFGGGALALLLLAILFGLSDLSTLARRARELSWGWAALGGLAALVSYAGIGACHRSLLALLGHELSLGLMVRAGFVSTVANRSLRSGGATGFAVLAWLLARRGVPSGAVLASTAGFLLLTNAVFGMLFVASVPIAATAVDRRPGALAALALVATGFLASLILGAVVVFHAGLRASWSRHVQGLVRRVGERFDRAAWEERAAGFLSRFDLAARLLLEKRWGTGPAWGWALFRIAASFACLWMAVAAAGPRLGLATLLLAFTASKMAGALALVPGGLGVIEGSLVSVLVLSGMEYELALLAALMNRVLYHLLPAAVALVLFGPVLAEARRAAARPPTP